MASPVAASLRARYPDATITWLAQPESVSLLQDNPNIDQVIAWPRQEWAQLLKQKKYPQLIKTILAFRRQLRAQQFDVALDLQGLLKSGFLGWLSGARRRISLGGREGSRYLATEVVSREGGDTRLIGSEYRHLLTCMGLPADPFSMSVGIGRQAAEKSREIIANRIGGPAYAIICPFTTRPQKHWFDPEWQTLAQRVKEELGLTVVMLGGPADREHAELIAAGAPDVVDLTGATSLQVAAALIGSAHLVVGVDTGLTHMGHASKVPTVALFGSTCPYLDAGEPTSKVIYHDFACSPCKRRPTCNGRFDCMRSITPQEVIQQAALLLNNAVIAQSS